MSLDFRDVAISVLLVALGFGPQMTFPVDLFSPESFHYSGNCLANGEVTIVDFADPIWFALSREGGIANDQLILIDRLRHSDLSGGEDIPPSLVERAWANLCLKLRSLPHPDLLFLG
jgi:hypothetical protein